jgi:hypothetical protein
MKRLVRVGLIVAGVAALGACSMFDNSPSAPAPQSSQSGYYDSQSHSSGYPGPGTHDQNRD